MADASGMVASAVIVPEAVEQTLSPTPTGATKRSQSSTSDGDNKRARISGRDPSENSNVAAAEQTSGSPPLQQTNSNTSRKARNVDSERQRGKRLFGALLGTLSQSSSSNAQKRRAEIEKKQRDKLREQAEEDDEKKRRVLEDLMAVRRVEQKKYDEQSMRIRHSNSLAMAGFLRTAAEPKLYYKPWDLLPQEKNRIEIQMREAEADINAELERYEQENPQPHATDVETLPQPTDVTQLEGTTDVKLEPGTTTTTTVGSSEAMAEVSTTTNDSDTNLAATTTNTSNTAEAEQAKELAEDNEDGVMVEAGEDPVIY